MTAMLKRERKMEWIPIARIVPNENNPRTKKHFTKDELIPLRASVEEHGVLEPILVQPYRDGPRDDRYLIVEGERRYTVANELGLKEIPAIINSRLEDHDQLVVMFNLHANRRSWEKAEELNAIRLLRRRDGNKSDPEMARELGMTLTTYRDRLLVLEEGGDDVVSDIAREKYDYSSALRVLQITSTLEKKRPQLVEDLGGKKAIREKLLKKAETKGISQELVEGRQDFFGDIEAVSDSVVKDYVSDPKLRLRDVRVERSSLSERRKADDLAKEVRRVEGDLRDFDVNLDEVPNLRPLREALGSLIDAATELEMRVVGTLIAA